MSEDRIRDQESQDLGSHHEFRPGGSDDPFFDKPNQQEASMNQDQTKGKFDQLKSKLKATWGRLSDDEIALNNGQRDRFLAKLQEKYGLVRDEAEDRLKEIEQTSTYKGEKAA